MFRLVSSAVVLPLVLSAAACGQGAPDTPFVSEAMAAGAAAVPANTPDYGWRTNISPSAGDGAVVEFY